MLTDYENWLSFSPYRISQQEKESLYLPYLNELTDYHRHQCPPYNHALQIFNYKKATTLSEIPFIPISIFKNMTLKSIPEKDIFKIITSSGTSGQAVSHIYLDQKNAQIQQQVLCVLGQQILGSKRLPMLIIDTPEVLTNRKSFNARSAAILGFSLFAKKKYFALHPDLSLNMDVLNEIKQYATQPFFIFGFTFMIWRYFYEALHQCQYTLDLSNAILIHGGGWKKMSHIAVSPNTFKTNLQNQTQLRHIYNYYGMAEQTGCIYIECEYGHLHASIFSDIIIRHPQTFVPCKTNETGIIQVLTPLATAYPGHSILTEDRGILLGIDDCPCGRKGKYFNVLGRIPHTELRGCSDVYR